MKRKLKLFVILVIMIFSTFSFASKTLFQTVEATYVEGLITQDTIWTLVDSPFVVSNDITVHSNATLTIEPGVQVRFGGAFFIIVSGKLYANGTEKAIKFISNREQPDVGDWKAIKFNGIEKSMLIGCFVAHATDGILVENGDVEIENSDISLCSQNGITAVDSKLTVHASTVSFCSQNGINSTNSELTVQDNTIIDNGGNGIIITGNEQVTIQRNTVVANGNGVLLTGNETSRVNISQNVISANEQNGIQLDAGDHTDLIIIYNNISSNYRGFYISSPTSTYITNNSISYNDIGIFYDQGSHTACFNDIYGNEKGMDIAFGADDTVNAEYNYWGHESGPYHESLNPSGKGNPIGGNGVNLDFIFFLTEPFGYINARPIATLLADKTIVPPDEMVMFFATNSFDEGRIDRYRFDFGDGNTSDWTTLSIFTHKYSEEKNYTASVAVMDDRGAISINNVTVTIHVQELPSLYVDIDVSDHVVYEGEQISIAVRVTDGTTAIDNANIKLFSLKGGNFTDSIGYTNSIGDFTTTFTAPDVTYITNVRIIATASKSDYADGSDYEYLEALPSLSLQIVADSSAIKSEETTRVTIYVKSNEQPVVGATVSIYSDGGSLSNTTGITDSDGVFLLDFTAPQTTDFLDVNITATAAKTGYANGMGQAIITVEPKVLVVHITAEPSVTVSEARVNVSVHVEYDMIPISDANVTITSESFSATGLTDVFGDVTFNIRAPQVNESSDITVIATASKDEYADGQSQLQIIVNPGELDVQVEVSESIVDSGESTVVAINVTCNGTPVKDALVTMSSTYGNFSVLTDTTDSKGHCEFVFNAPRTTMQLTPTIAANATKNGYITGENQTTITVTPETMAGGGWPLTTILLIVIPIAIVVIIVVLVKLKVITFSSEEE
jgi:co-chaperonin GroES (HSP10)